MVPTYRPDSVVDPDTDGFAANVARLGDLGPALLKSTTKRARVERSKQRRGRSEILRHQSWTTRSLAANPRVLAEVRISFARKPIGDRCAGRHLEAN